MEIEALVGVLRQRLPTLLAVYAFGSRVHGTAGPQSDLDLGLLATSRLDPLVLWELGPALASVAGSEVDLLDLRASSTVVQHRVLETGLRWFVGDPLAVDLWELQVLRDKQELEELRAPLIEDILRSGVVHGR